LSVGARVVGVPDEFPRPGPMLNVLLDFDGTLVESNVAIELVKEFCPDGGALAHEIDLKLSRGEITLREAWARQVALLPADRMAELVDYAVEHSRLRRGAVELIEALTERAVPVTILSGGLDFYIGPIMHHAGLFLPVLSDVVRRGEDGKLRLEHPHGHPSCQLCGICKAQVAWAPSPKRPRSVFIGDGGTDRYAAEVSDIVFARYRLRTYCELRGIPHFAFEEFPPVTSKIVGWLDGTEPLPPRRELGMVESACPVSRQAASASAAIS
jgi:2-hydroxy-3-keto-5-methylthiopentenyl-1-phosphate phosphatase